MCFKNPFFLKVCSIKKKMVHEMDYFFLKDLQSSMFMMSYLWNNKDTGTERRSVEGLDVEKSAEHTILGGTTAVTNTAPAQLLERFRSNGVQSKSSFPGDMNYISEPRSGGNK